MDDFTKFNLIEGTFWIFLSAVSFVLSKKLRQRYRVITLISSGAFLLFGISDLLEAQLGSFLEPHLWWLFLWKIVIVGIFFLIIAWYFKLRLLKKST